MLIRAAALIGLSFALGWAAFHSGGVWPPDWDIALLVIGGSVALFALCDSGRRTKSAPLGPVLSWLITAFPLCLAATLIPLPASVLRLLSPERAALLYHLRPIIPGLERAPLAVTPAATVLSLFSILGCTAVFLTIRRLSLSFSSKRWIIAAPLIAIAAFEAGLGLLQAFGGSGSDAVAGTYTNRDHFAGLLELVFPFALLQGFAALQRGNGNVPRMRPAFCACSLFGLSVLLFLAIAHSLSRMGFIVVLLELLLVWLLGFRSWLSRPRRWPLVAGVAAVVILVCVFLSPEQLSARFSTISSHSETSREIRASVWKDTLPLIAEYPILGCGLGGFESVFPKHQSVANGYAVEFVHNDYLQYLVELGIAGFSLLAAIIAILFCQTVRSTLHASDPDRRLILLASTAAFSGILLHSFVDFNMYIPANMLTFSWVAGIASANAARG